MREMTGHTERIRDIHLVQVAAHDAESGSRDEG